MAKKATREILEFLFVGPLFSIYKELNQLRRKVNNVATQAEVDAVSAKVDGVSTQLTKGIGEVKAELDRVVNANPSIDLGGLSERVDGLGGLAQELDNVVPDALPAEGTTPAEPTPEPEPTPDETATP